MKKIDKIITCLIAFIILILILLGTYSKFQIIAKENMRIDLTFYDNTEETMIEVGRSAAVLEKSEDATMLDALRFVEENDDNLNVLLEYSEGQVSLSAVNDVYIYTKDKEGVWYLVKDTKSQDLKENGRLRDVKVNDGDEYSFIFE